MTMRDCVRAVFLRFTEPLEGRVPFLYLDVKGLVTIAYGNLVDPRAYALDLPLLRPDGVPASKEEIGRAWDAVKKRTDLAPRGGLAFRSVTDLRLSPDGLERVAMRKVDQLIGQLAIRYPRMVDWPADAQLAILSLAWACGAWFRFPRMDASLLERDFEQAARESKIADDRGTIKERNRRNFQLLMNAAHVIAHGMDPSRLYWPAVLADETPTAVDIPNPSSSPTVLVEGPDDA